MSEPTVAELCEAAKEDARRRLTMRPVVKWMLPSVGMQKIRELAETREVTEVDLYLAGGYPMTVLEGQ